MYTSGCLLTKSLRKVGSGPAGLILALSLLQNGIPTRIIEKEPTHHISERGTGIMVVPLLSSNSNA